MARANPDNCPHPRKKLERTHYGAYHCTRCGADRTEAMFPGRTFTVRHSPRVTLNQFDRVAVCREYHGGAFKGIFLYATTFPSGVAYTIAETQTWKHEGKTREDWAALRTVRPEFVRQAPGVRDRKAREEVNV